MYRTLIAFTGVLTASVCVGCTNDAANPEQENVASSEDKLIGVLTSPLGIEDKHLDGTWVPVEPDQFVGAAKSIQFAKSDGVRTYRLMSDGTAPAATPNGNWFITNNPIVWVFAGSYVTFRKESDPSYDKSLFIWRKADGEIRLVDLDTWDWHSLSYRNTYRRTPALTVTDL